MQTKTIIIREHKRGSCEVITGVPLNTPGNEVVERWQRGTIHYQVHGTLPAATWKIAENPNLLDALIESATFARTGPDSE